ncbi:unnamed protein product [Linum tenue]|nr:unnamed protein product [Linum tenue]
MIGEYA